MSKAKPSRAELEQDIEALRKRVRELESRQIASAFAEEVATGSETKETASAPSPDRASVPADILCLSPHEWRDTLETVCRQLGHRPVCASDLSDLEQIQGRFALVIAADAHPETPFCAPTMNRLLSGEVPGIVVERGLLLGAMAPLIGHEFAHLHRGSSFCQIPDNLCSWGETDCQALCEAITDVLSLPPYEDVNYYDEVSYYYVH